MCTASWKAADGVKWQPGLFIQNAEVGKQHNDFFMNC